MDKKLPGVFVNKISKKMTNNKTVYYGGREEEKVEEVKKQNSSSKPEVQLNTKQKLNQIFKSVNYIYKMDVKITLKDKTLTKRIIGYNDHDVITFDNELIPISEIIDIEVSQKES
ncbi:MAG: hypothetical protein PHN72_00180 [Bacilli bacterium]|nr:hypothetical protein [Bacilli bacterium]